MTPDQRAALCTAFLALAALVLTAALAQWIAVPALDDIHTLIGGAP